MNMKQQDYLHYREKRVSMGKVKLQQGKKMLDENKPSLLLLWTGVAAGCVQHIS
jgi:hypothetical protein